jgi:hypothetical protein
MHQKARAAWCRAAGEGLRLHAQPWQLPGWAGRCAWVTVSDAILIWRAQRVRAGLRRQGWCVVWCVLYAISVIQVMLMRVLCRAYTVLTFAAANPLLLQGRAARASRVLCSRGQHLCAL